ncbi:MAG TPA: sugar ABC transporter ATP-binding protein [Mesorhizobium sp.]|jgi:ribose transport system ATP-binding protein|nr:sugar ABC transporter ATP-binding protein [Mesorhizobium sp.]
MTHASKLLELSRISKRYGPLLALDDVDFDVMPGEVHVLFGENGAGKSTMINVITGNVGPDGGSYRLLGNEVRTMTPQEARRRGIAAVFQEFSLVPDLTVLENLFLGRERRIAGLLKRAEMRREADAFIAKLGFNLPLDRLVVDLPRAQRQLLEVAKALFEEARILILDEPTASLTDTDADRLFDLLFEMKRDGVGIVYVSHRMREIRLLADRVTVLRGGRKVATVAGADVSEAQLVEMMVGRPVGDLYPAIAHKPGKPLLEIEKLSSVDGRVRDVSLAVREGEIVGLAGLVGCGKGEIGRLVFGLDPISGGSVRVKGKPVARFSPRALLRRGVCYFPADRATDGLAPNRPIRENASAAALDLKRFGGGGWLRRRAENSKVREVFERLGVRPLRLEQTVLQFSGGNRQKVMLARGLMREIQIFLFDEPTVGIDVGAKAEIYQLMRDLAEGGAAILLISSELPEILNLSHRIYVMHEGEIVTHLEGEQRTEAQVLSGFFGKNRTKAAA